MYKIHTKDNKTILTDIDFNIRHTCDCGQCFRFLPHEGGYLGVAYGKAIFVEEKPEGVVFHCDAAEFGALWQRFFDLDTDYASVADKLPKDDFTAKAVEFGRGLRILRQEPWEALCSFIISQNNNIPRIMGIIDRLCESFGEKISENDYAFPTYESLKNVTAEDLAPLRAGFRNKYIADAVSKLCSGEINLEKIKEMPIEQARTELMKIKGVGAKVAECTLLYGFGIFPSLPFL